MWLELLSTVFFQAVVLLAWGAPKIIISPQEDAQIYYMGLSDQEKAMVMKEGKEMAGEKTMVQDKGAMSGGYGADQLDCQCSDPALGEPACACQFQMPIIDFKIMHAIGFNPEDRSISLLLAIDEYMIVNDRIMVYKQKSYEPGCKSLPPPTMWMRGCFRTTIEEGALGKDGSFLVCSSLDIEILVEPKKYEKIIEMDFTCFDYHEENGIAVMCLQNHKVDEGDVGVKNIMVKKNFAQAAGQLNNLKISRMMKNPSGEKEVDTVEGSFWDDVEHDDVKSKSSKQQVAAQEGNVQVTAMKNWWPLGIDEVPYLAILFKSVVATKMAAAQGMAGFSFIRDAINQATSQKNADWHESVIPDVFKPGLSCGGALLSPKKLLTICACIQSFYYQNKAKKPPPGPISKFDITNAEDIFVEFSMIQFTNSQYFHLDRNASSYMEQSTCFKMIDEKSEDLQAVMVVMPFTPRIPSDNPYHYILWPPYPIHEKYKRRPVVNWKAFGMQNKESKMIDAVLMGVVLAMYRNKTNEHCMTATFNKAQVPDQLKLKTTCFLTRDPPNQLCGGLPGFPITWGDELAGLSASPMDCNEEGSMMGAVFDDLTVQEVELYAGKGLKTRREANHNFLFREPSNIVQYIPDYTTMDSHQQLSSAQIVDSSTLLLIFMVFGKFVNLNKLE